ncbi:MAG: MFS transporter [Caldilineaceae bacterium]|nr:MFS transporter [Caldilineaceae bacterium]
MKTMASFCSEWEGGISSMIRNWSVIRTFNIDMRRFLASWTLSAFAYFGMLTVLLNLFLLRAGFEVEEIGLVVAAGQIAWAVCALPAGAVGARFGLRFALIAGYALVCAGMSLLLLVEALPRNLWVPWVVATWMITWAGASLLTVNGRPFLDAGEQRRKPPPRVLGAASAHAHLGICGKLGCRRAAVALRNLARLLAR